MCAKGDLAGLKKAFLECVQTSLSSEAEQNRAASFGSKICIETIKLRHWTLSEIRDICGHVVANRDFQELESKHPSPSLSFFGSI